jgi:hypothetical protein
MRGAIIPAIAAYIADESGTIGHTRPQDMHQPSRRRRPLSGLQPYRARHMGSDSCRGRPARTVPGHIALMAA